MKSPARLLFVTHRLELEGAPFSLFFLARGFKNAGYHVEVVSPVDGKLRQYYEQEKIKLHIINFTTPDKLNIALDFDAYFVNTLDGHPFIDKLDLDKHKVIWCIRESEREQHFKEKSYLKEETFKKVKRVVFVADATREIYADLDHANFVTIHNGLDISRVDDYLAQHTKEAVREDLGFDAKELIINLTGTVSLRKGHQEFTAAAIEILKASPSLPLKFIMVGGGAQPAFERTITDMIQLNGMQDRIQVIPETTDVFDYYLACDIFVCNSYIESFPRVVLEAMAFSLPIVATRIYGIPEQINDGQEGLLVTAGDVHGLAAKIDYLIKNAVEAQKLGQAARERLETDFTEDVMLKKYIDLIDQVCAE